MQHIGYLRKLIASVERLAVKRIRCRVFYYFPYLIRHVSCFFFVHNTSPPPNIPYFINMSSHVILLFLNIKYSSIYYKISISSSHNLSFPYFYGIIFFPIRMLKYHYLFSSIIFFIIPSINTSFADCITSSRFLLILLRIT